MISQEQKERLTAWVEALESGKYKQCRQKLKNIDNKYCCLGVALDIYKEQTGKGSWDDYGTFKNEGIAPTAGYLDNFYLNYFGLNLTSVRTQEKYAAMNDEDRKSFKKIAAQIREDFELND